MLGLEMKAVIAALFLVFVANSSLAETKLPAPPLIGSDPPAHVSRWIGIYWRGLVAHPIIPIFYTIERAVPRHDDEVWEISRYVALTSDEYQRLSRFVHTYRCSADISRKTGSARAIVVEESTHGGARTICYLPDQLGCDFLTRLASVPAIDWEHRDNWPLFQFELELNCKSPPAKWH